MYWPGDGSTGNLLCEETMGSKVAAELFSAVAEEVREQNIPAPDSEARH